MKGFKNFKIIHLCRHKKTYGYGYSPLGFGGYTYCEECEKYVSFINDKTYPKMSKARINTK